MTTPQIKRRVDRLFSDFVIPEPTPALPEDTGSVGEAPAAGTVRDHAGDVTLRDYADDVTLVSKSPPARSPHESGRAASSTGTAAGATPGPTRRDELSPGPIFDAGTGETILSAEVAPSFELPASAQGLPERNVWIIVWGILLAFAVLVLAATLNLSDYLSWPSSPVTEAQPQLAVPLSPTPAATASPTPVASTTVRAALFNRQEPTPAPTAVPGGQTLVLTADEQASGWLSSDEDDLKPIFGAPNHLGEPVLYAGMLDGQAYLGAFQFDLDLIPRGTQVKGASLRLTGLRADLLDPQGEGSWQLQLLGPEVDHIWPQLNFRQIRQAAVLGTFQPLTQAQLRQRQILEFELTPEQLTYLERRILAGDDRIARTVSFRIDGPAGDEDNLFAWTSGSDEDGEGVGPELFLNLGPPPEGTPLPVYVVITSTPTPESVLTAVANSLRLTAEATRRGTVTPLPPDWVTPVVVTATPTPANEATARRMQQEATAIALTTGQPPNLATATATSAYVIITSTPTPANVQTAVAEALQAGPQNPLPPNWVTPFVVTSTPVPENQATADVVRAVILTTGTPTPLPANAQTATPTPVLFGVSLLASPTATATSSPTLQPLPANLVGKIIFLSEREGATEEERARAGALRATPEVIPQPYVYDPATGQLNRLTDRWPYDVAAARDSWLADTVYEAYTQLLLWTNVNGRPTEELAIHYYDHFYKTEQIVTEMGAGIVYDPAWSPVSDEIAFVSTESGNDEIWTIRRDGSDVRQLTRNNWEWDKHPSWSPDGQQIVFFSNRTGNSQIWIMNKDGSEQRPLMEGNSYNDFDPVWVKYVDPPPPLLRQQDWRFQKPAGEVPGNQ